MFRSGNKFNARKVVLDGITFDSGLEASRYQELVLLQRVGDISDLEVHPPSYELIVTDTEGYGALICKYTADFRYKQAGKLVVEDVKGKPTRTRDYMIRKKLMRALLGITIYEWPPKPKRGNKATTSAWGEHGTWLPAKKA